LDHFDAAQQYQRKQQRHGHGHGGAEILPEREKAKHSKRDEDQQIHRHIGEEETVNA
jgi:hypothetical protein